MPTSPYVLTASPTLPSPGRGNTYTAADLSTSVSAAMICICVVGEKVISPFLTLPHTLLKIGRLATSATSVTCD